VQPLRLSLKLADDDDECFLRSKFTSQDGTTLESDKSEHFDVIYRFNVTASLLKTIFKPSDTLVAEVTIDGPENTEATYLVDLIVDGKLSRYESDEKQFSISYVLPTSISSGRQDIVIQVEDSFENTKEYRTPITVMSIPTKITHVFSRDTYYANQVNETLGFKPVLYDQGNDLIDDKPVTVRIVDPDGKTVATDTIISTTRFSMDVPITLKPGKYIIISSYQNITKESYITILNNAYVAPEPIVEENKSTITGNVVLDEDTKTGFNLWKYVAFVLLFFIVLYGAYMYGKTSAKPKNKKAFFKDDAFFQPKKKNSEKKE
jgi:hypothetical protein